jgi:hypothetical protein
MNKDDESITSEEAELLECFHVLDEEDQEAMLRVVGYLATRPKGEPLTMEQMDELFQRAKRLQ